MYKNKNYKSVLFVGIIPHDVILSVCGCNRLHLHYLCSFLASACELTVQWELWPTCLCLSVTLWIWPWYQSRARSTTSRPASRESFSCSSSFICFNCVIGKLKKKKKKKRWCFEGDGGRRGGRKRVRW